MASRMEHFRDLEVDNKKTPAYDSSQRPDDEMLGGFADIAPLHRSTTSKHSDDEMLRGDVDTSPLHPSTSQAADDARMYQTVPYPIQNQPRPYYPGPPPANPAYPSDPYMPPQSHYGMQNTHSTTVIIQQPSQPQFLGPRNWSSDLCECGRDCSICCCGVFCLCCLESEVAQDMGESCMLPCCVPGWLITLRTKMRVQENISGSVMNDCCHVCCCYQCTLCQLAYEIRTVRERTMAGATTMRPL